MFVLSLLSFILLSYRAMNTTITENRKPSAYWDKVDPSSLEYSYADNQRHVADITYEIPTQLTPKHLFFRNEKKHTLPGRVKAVIVILTRNSELDSLLRTLKQFEEKFNSKYRYPYVFLNDQEFTETFKTKTSAVISAKAKYGLVPKDHWGFPDWLNVTFAKESIKKMEREGVQYGGSESYRHMCRFYSGFFFRHPLLEEYDYYWRVEPGVEFYCDINYDPFSFMASNNKMYGFTVSVMESNNTIPTLWKTTREFISRNQDIIPRENALKFIWNEKDGNYNLCHFWSNFEIADLRLWRTEKYLQFFNYLDKTGKFFVERWGDAPVHSIAAAMFLHPSQIHFFEDIGYNHWPYAHCPMSVRDQVRGNCQCDATISFDWHEISCLRWFHHTIKHALNQKYIDINSYPPW
ncbi:glycolipid 2-alpha-mannosyltransferase [Paraphysoderma sedebokerense]|nr:glycolipid 2-alpha-mannosyltransferase [Paraphysoderma sedebokerense]